MWQADTFDPKTIDTELGYAQGIGMNVMRVFLHHLAWKEDPEGFKKRVDQYLTISSRHGVQTMFVFFDDCWKGQKTHFFYRIKTENGPVAKQGFYYGSSIFGCVLKCMMDFC